jgi:hypothetical protein
MAEKREVKRGRPRIFNSPDELWACFEEYVEHNKQNPRYKYEMDKTGNVVPVPVHNPLTLEAFNLFIFYKGLGEGCSQYLENTGKAYNDYLGVSTRIREAVRADHIGGGMTGFYNASLTARIHGLTEKREDTIKTDDNTLRIIVERMDGKK